MNFTNAHTISPACSPCRNALLFGVEPHKSGLYGFYRGSAHKVFHERYISLPRFFKENGYKTFGAGKNHHGTRGDEIEWSGHAKLDHMAIRDNYRFNVDQGYYDADRDVHYCPTSNSPSEHLDYKVASFGIEILEQQHDHPFFLAIGLQKPHKPFVCPQEFFDLFPVEIVPPPILADDQNDISWAGRALTHFEDDYVFSRDNAWTRVRRAYLACIAWTDYNVGRVLDALEESPYAENTIIILWSDHGFFLGEKRSFSKFALWEEATRVPFIIYDPSQKDWNGSFSEPVSLMSIYRTLAEMTGLAVPEYVDGYSLVPLMENLEKEMGFPVLTTWGRGNHTLRNNDFRYIRYFDGSEELYDHREDPNEWINLAGNPNYQSKKVELSKYVPKGDAPSLMPGENGVPHFSGGVRLLAGADAPEAIQETKELWDSLKNRITPPLPD